MMLQKWMNKRFLLYLIFLTIAIIFHVFTIPLIFGVSISFAPIFYLAIIRLFGLRYALVATLIINGISYTFQFNEAFYFLNVIEVLVIGSLYKKKGKDLFTWSFVYCFLLILYFMIYQFFIPVDISSEFINFTIFQLVLSTLFSALIADILCDYLPYIPKIGSVFMDRNRLYFGQIISHILIFFAVCPILIFILLYSRSLEADMYEQWKQSLTQLNYTLRQEVVEMDSEEIQNFSLDSDLEKARLKSLLEHEVGDSNARIYLINSNTEVWLSTADQLDSNEDGQVFQTGFVKEIHENGFIWFSENNPNFLAWYEGKYIGHTTFLNKDVYLLIPVDKAIYKAANKLERYLLIAMLILFFALVCGIVSNHILSQSLGFITKITSDLPRKVQTKQAFNWSDTNIYEFAQLRENIEKVALELQKMFRETKLKNKLLMEKTNQLTESETKLSYLAHYDSLTNLPNRYSFYKDMDALLKNSVDHIFAVVFLDLDKFKQVNDTLGHSGGDELLKLFAKRLLLFEEEHRSFHVYRLAGDEFVSTIKKSLKEEVYAVCDELEKVILQPINIKGTSITLSASVGVSFYPVDGRTIDELLHNADTLMYKEKERNHQRELSIIKENHNANI